MIPLGGRRPRLPCDREDLIQKMTCQRPPRLMRVRFWIANEPLPNLMLRQKAIRCVAADVSTRSRTFISTTSFFAAEVGNAVAVKLLISFSVSGRALKMVKSVSNSRCFDKSVSSSMTAARPERPKQRPMISAEPDCCNRFGKPPMMVTERSI